MEEEKFVKIVVVGDGKFIYKTKKNLFFFFYKRPSRKNLHNFKIC